MGKVIFITGNQAKADFLAKYLGHEVEHRKLDLNEIQSLDQHEITENKARQAYEKLHVPVLVEDVSLTIKAMGKLPGPFIRWFEQELGHQGICKLVDSFDDRTAIASVVYAYFDGESIKFFDGKLNGQIAKQPSRDDGFGWNSIFIPDGSTKTSAEMDEKETQRFSLRTTTVYPEIKKFLSNLDTGEA